MRRVHSHGNKDIEVVLAGLLHGEGLKGWRVLRVWEHRLRRPGSALGRLRRAVAVEPISPPA